VSSAASLVIEGANRSDRLGTSAAVEDINGDGKADLLLGATGTDVGDLANAGTVYILLGNVFDRESSPVAASGSMTSTIGLVVALLVVVAVGVFVWLRLIRPSRAPSS
jgi:hypothetical protein